MKRRFTACPGGLALWGLSLLAISFEFATANPLEEKILTLAKDPDPRVRFQAALTLGEVDLPQRAEALASIARQDSGDPWVRRAILSSVGQDVVEFLEILIPEVDDTSEGIDSLIGELSKLIGAKGNSQSIGRLLSVVGQSGIHEKIQILSLEGLSEGLKLYGSELEEGSMLAQPLASLLGHPSPEIREAGVGIAAVALPPDSPALKELIEGKVSILEDPESEGREAAATMLRLGSFDRVSKSLIDQLTVQGHEALQVASIDTLATYDRPEVGVAVVENWGALAPKAKVRALDLLLARNDRAMQLLEAIESDRIPANALDSQRQTLLTSYPDGPVAEKAKSLFASITSDEDPELYRNYAESIDLEGDREHGKKIYVERCAQCHIAEGEGQQLGPDWSGLKSNTRETLLTSILYPNREVDPGFTSYLLETVDGEIYTGILAFSGPNSVVLKRGGGEEDTILRKNIDYLEDTKKSIMPTNLELGLTPQDMADLLSFIETLN